MIFGRCRSEKLLGISYPDAVAEAGFERVQPSPELAMYTAYIKLTGPADDLIEIASRLHLHRAGEEGALRYLPTSWAGPAGSAIDWWDASPDTPPEAYASSFGVAGWIVAKLERGALYVIATDTGHTE